MMLPINNRKEEKGKRKGKKLSGSLCNSVIPLCNIFGNTERKRGKITKGHREKKYLPGAPQF